MDIFDTFASYKPYNIFVVRWPSMPLNNYLEKIDNLVEATFWCTDEKIFDLVKSNNKIYITNITFFSFFITISLMFCRLDMFYPIRWFMSIIIT